MLKQLLRKGATDSILQVAATSGTRLSLVLAMFALSGFVDAADIATYDLFLVASSVILIALTFGLDSGLAIVTQVEDERERQAYLWTAILVSASVSIGLFAPLLWAVATFDETGVFGAPVFALSYCYAVASSMMTLVFSYFRWVGNSRAASLILVSANAIGLVVGTLGFYLMRTIDSFIGGLAVGNGIGVIATFVFVARSTPSGAMAKVISHWRSMARKLFAVSWPFGMASFALIGRRSIDRAVLLAFASPSLLGSYALVLRFAETLAFFLSVPAQGYSPLILQNRVNESGRRLAVLLYHGYCIAALLVFVIVSLLWNNGLQGLLPASAQSASSVFLILLAASLFFGESAVAGFGFIIIQRTKWVAMFSLLFIGINVAIAIPVYAAGWPLEGVAVGFLIAALVHSSLFIYVSEKFVRFGYKLMPIFLAKLAVAITVCFATLNGPRILGG